MAIGIQGISQWQTWRSGLTAADSGAGLLTDLRPAEVWDSSTNKWNTDHNDKVISVHPFTAIAVAFLGDAAGGTAPQADFIITGFMFPDSKAGPGPGYRLIDFNVTWTADSDQWGTADVPLNDGKWTSAQWNMASVITIDGYDAATGTVFSGSGTEVTQQLLLSTTGFSHLFLELDALASVTTVGVIWRGISKEGVL